MSMIRMRYQPTFRGFLALNVHAAARLFCILIVVALCSLILYLLQPLAYRLTGHAESTLDIYRSNSGLLIIPAVVVWLLVARYFGVRSRWRKAEELRIEREYEIDESGVRVTGISLSGFLEWRHFIHGDFRGGYFFLKTAQNQFHYFPASAVPEKSCFVELVGRKVAVSKRWKNA